MNVYDDLSNDVYITAIQRVLDNVDFSDYYIKPDFHISWGVDNYGNSMSIHISFKLAGNIRSLHLNKYKFPLIQYHKVPDEEIRSAIIHIRDSIKADVLEALLAEHNRVYVTEYIKGTYGSYNKYKMMLKLKAIDLVELEKEQP